MIHLYSDVETFVTLWNGSISHLKFCAFDEKEMPGAGFVLGCIHFLWALTQILCNSVTICLWSPVNSPVILLRALDFL